MLEPILRLLLGVDERRGEERPAPVTRVEWGADDLPSRAYFMAAVEVAYGSIELPYFPHAAWVEVATATRSETFGVAQPEDQEFVGPALWNAVATFAAGYG